jgi:hypothetical protein
MRPSGSLAETVEAGLPTIYVVDGDEGLSYLLQRYSVQAGMRFCEVGGTWHIPPGPHRGRAAIWFSSLERLDLVRPREKGVGEDMPVIVCAFAGDEARARELGADFCAFDPLSYSDFLAALRAVGLSSLERVPSEQEAL